MGNKKRGYPAWLVHVVFKDDKSVGYDDICRSKSEADDIVNYYKTSCDDKEVVGVKYCPSFTMG